MAGCFLCGSIDEDEAWFDGKEYFENIIFNFITKNNIHTIYTLNRNLFDDIVEDAINMLDYGINASIVKVCCTSPNPHLTTVLSDDSRYNKSVFPFDYDLDPTETYAKLYKWMIDNSEFIITYCIDDSDITLEVLNNAREKGITIYNIAEHISLTAPHMSKYNIIPFKKNKKQADSQ